MNYSYLEDVWTKKPKSKKSKSKSKKKVDPLCELYAKQYNTVTKPYLDDDAEFKSDSYFYLDKDDEYFANAIKNTKPTLLPAEVEGEGEGEEEDNNVENTLKQPLPLQMIQQSELLKELMNSIKELKKELHQFKPEKKVEMSQEQQLLEYGLFIVAGIMLIFILDQFVQIGGHISKKKFVM